MTRLGSSLAAGAMLAGGAMACCIVTHAELAKMMKQENIIVWEPDTKTEHFIRNAKFATRATDLGFVAPTPSVPKLEEVDAKAFTTLESLVEDFHVAGMNKSAAMDTETPASKIDVIQNVEVAGYNAVTLRASDAKGLAEWMKQSGFVSTPAIQSWTDFYIQKGWYFTAFKVNVTDGRAETGLVKMSFKTERPFNPYFVPADNLPAADQREGLALYFVSTGIYSPEGDHASFKMSVAAPLRPEDSTDLKSQLRLANLPKDATVAAFTDSTFPNGAQDDLYFEQSGPKPEWPKAPSVGIASENADGSENPSEPFPIIPVVAAVLVVLGGVLLWRNRK
ncbi:MAG: DUF2330 domain-containing protein [Fimbriimonadaceae bacterium]